MLSWWVAGVALELPGSALSLRDDDQRVSHSHQHSHSSSLQVDRYVFLHTFRLQFLDGIKDVHLCSCSTMAGAWQLLRGHAMHTEHSSSVMAQLSCCIHSQAASALRSGGQLGEHIGGCTR